MQPTIEKSSETEIVVTSSKVIDISEIIKGANDAQEAFDNATKSLADFEAWVSLERSARQTIIDEAQNVLTASASLIDEAAKVGVVDLAIDSLT